MLKLVHNYMQYIFLWLALTVEDDVTKDGKAKV